ncbi:MAG TPA: hypothetical protein VGN70_08415, partial [Gammaproteobacteria bacterium]
DTSPTPKDGLYAGVQSGSIALSNGGGTTTPKAGQYVYIAGSNGVSVPGTVRPQALTQLPDPKTCN